MTDVLGDTKWLGDLLKMTVGEKCGQTQTPCFLLLQIQTCCPSLLLKLFIFHILQFTKESLWIWICLSSLLWIQCISSTWERVAFYNLGKVSPVSLYTLPHSHALRPLLLESWLDAARPSRSLQNTGFSWLVHAVLCPAFWAISSALSSIPRSPHLLIWYTSSRFLEPVCSFSLCPFLHQAPLACSAWNHFHTLTAQSLASCPGALRILLVTTADSPSSSSTVSPSSRGLCVVRWPHVPRAGGVSPLSTAPRALMGGIPPTVCFLATFPTWGDMWITYSKWLMSLKPHLLCLSLSVRQKRNIPANPYNKNCVKKLQNMKHGNARCEGSLLPHAGGQHPDLGLGLQQTPLTLCPDQAPLLKLCFTNVRRYADMVCSKWMLLLSCYHYIIIISIHYKVLIWFAQALNDWS